MLRRREHRTPDHTALPRGISSQAAVRSAPGRDRAEARPYTEFRTKGKAAEPARTGRAAAALARLDSSGCRGVLGPVLDQGEGMSLAFVFPGPRQPGGRHGQGAGRRLCAGTRRCSRRSMRRSARSSPSIIWEGPAETLTLTENAQPALMAVSLAAMRVLEAEAGVDLARDAQFVAGHSLGEYSALAAARRAHDRRHRAALAHPRSCHAEGGAGRHRRHGGAAWARLRSGGAIAAEAAQGQVCAGRQRQWRRTGGRVRRQGRGRARGRDRQGERAPARHDAAGVRPLPLRADAARRRCHGRGAGEGRGEAAGGAGRRQRAGQAGQRSGARSCARSSRR